MGPYVFGSCTFTDLVGSVAGITTGVAVAMLHRWDKFNEFGPTALTWLITAAGADLLTSFVLVHFLVRAAFYVYMLSCVRLTRWYSMPRRAGLITLILWSIGSYCVRPSSVYVCDLIPTPPFSSISARRCGTFCCRCSFCCRILGPSSE